MKLIAKLFAFITLISLPALAHVENGKWVGKTPEGSACEMTANGMYFENNQHHPLNERVKISVNGMDFVLRHPPVIDVATTTAFFNHDMFQGINPTADGAVALQINMVHTPSKEGPTGFTLITNKWRTDEKTALVCNDIALVP